MKNFDQWLKNSILECGGLSAACLDLNSLSLQNNLQLNGAKSQNWIDSGYAGDMSYLQRMQEDKINPQQAFPGAQSVIVITYKNKWGLPEATHPFPKPRPGKLTGYISSYAKEQDYHRTGQQILDKLHKKIQNHFGEFSAQAAVDTKPVFERLLAVLGGLGIRGPNDLLRTPEENVRVFIGSLFCNIELPEVIQTAKMPYPCEHCQNCLENCPTGAIQKDQDFDSTKCISYLTIEKKGTLSAAERTMMEDWLFGCDWCSVVCPPKDKEDSRIPIELEWILKTSAGEIRRTIKGTAIEYAGVTKLRRNAVAILRESQAMEAQDLLNWAQNNLKSQIVLEQIDCM
jgi:epoxyqueuosine reductase